MVPHYGMLDRFGQEYVKKECNSEEFKLILNKKMKHEVLICKKVSNSSFDKLKKKLLGSK